MTGETPLTVVGNLTADPELRYTQQALPVVNFTVASTPRILDRQSNEWKDGEALFLRCSAWREFAENIAADLAKGMRVVVTGNLVQKGYKDREGNQRTAYELQVLDIGQAVRHSAPKPAQQSSQQGGSWAVPKMDDDVPF